MKINLKHRKIAAAIMIKSLEEAAKFFLFSHYHSNAEHLYQQFFL